MTASKSSPQQRGGNANTGLAVTTRKKAATVVQKRLEVGWKATLTDKQITVRQAHKLKLRLNDACRWEPDTEAP